MRRQGGRRYRSRPLPPRSASTQAGESLSNDLKTIETLKRNCLGIQFQKSPEKCSSRACLDKIVQYCCRFLQHSFFIRRKVPPAHWVPRVGKRLVCPHAPRRSSPVRLTSPKKRAEAGNDTPVADDSRLAMTARSQACEKTHTACLINLEAFPSSCVCPEPGLTNDEKESHRHRKRFVLCFVPGRRAPHPVPAYHPAH